MADRIHVGDKLPFFLYDTPYSAKNRFRDLLSQRAPLVLVFMANFGHPITRTFVGRYAATYDQPLRQYIRSLAGRRLCAGGALPRGQALPQYRAEHPALSPALRRGRCFVRASEHPHEQKHPDELLAGRLAHPARSEKAGLQAHKRRRTAAAADTDSGSRRHGAVLPLRRKPDRRARGLRGHPEPVGGTGTDTRTQGGCV